MTVMQSTYVEDPQRMTIHAGDQLDHYRIDGLAARSGMASIFRATDLNTGRPVAIKIPHLEVESDPTLFDRFRREEEIGKPLSAGCVLMRNLDIVELYESVRVGDWVWIID